MKNRPMLSKEELGKRLKRLRKDKNMTQFELARRMNVSRSAVSNWEVGYRYPETEDLKNLAVIFGVPADYFYGVTDFKYNVNMNDCFELDLTILNDLGLFLLKEFFKFLKSNPKFLKPVKEEN